MRQLKQHHQPDEARACFHRGHRDVGHPDADDHDYSHGAVSAGSHGLDRRNRQIEKVARGKAEPIEPDGSAFLFARLFSCHRNQGWD
jgi:hypothetical protein